MSSQTRDEIRALLISHGCRLSNERLRQAAKVVDPVLLGSEKKEIFDPDQGWIDVWEPSEFAIDYSEIRHLAAKELARRDPSQPVQDGFVASGNSQVFHRATCDSAAEIAEKNIVRYATRDEAIKAGKRPCADCGP
jgi:hypothetical protein